MAQLSARNKAVLIDAVVHAVNEDYKGMAEDFIKLGFLAPGRLRGGGQEGIAGGVLERVGQKRKANFRAQHLGRGRGSRAQTEGNRHSQGAD